MSRVLVTGGSGLVGHSLHKYSDWLFPSSKELDLLDHVSTMRYFDNIRPTIVVHLAARVGGLYRNLNENMEMFHDNMKMNLNIVQACEQYKVTKLIVVLSTCIFPDKCEYPLDESMIHMGPPHHSNEGYAYAKRMLEVQTKLLKNTKTICLIPTNLFGPHDNFDLTTAHVIPALINKAVNNKTFNVLGSGRALRQFLYVEDFANIIHTCVNWEQVNEHELFICAPNEEDEVYIEYVVDIIKNHVGIDEITYDMTCSDGQYKKTASNKKLLETFPNIKFSNFEEKLKDTINWYIK